MKRRLGAGVGVAALTLVALASPAFADRLVIRKVDTRNFPQVEATAIADGSQQPQPSAFNVRENGLFVHGAKVATVDTTGDLMGVVLVVDTSSGTGDKGRLDQIKVAARQFVANKLANVRVAIVSYGDAPALLTGFTADAAVLDEAITKLHPSGGAKLWDGISRAVALFKESPDPQANIVVLSAAPDAGSTATPLSVTSAVLESKAALFSVGLRGTGVPESALQGLSDKAAGQYVAADTSVAVPTLLAGVQQSLQHQYRISYTSKAASPTIDLDVTAGPLQGEARAVSVGTLAQGSNVRPEVVHPKSLGPFSSSTGKWLILLLVLAAAGLAAYAVLPLVLSDRSQLESALVPYLGEAVAGGDDEGSSKATMAKTAFVQRAVGLTARLATERGVLQWLEMKLEQADLPLRPAEALFFYIVGAVVMEILALVLWGLFGGLIMLAIALVLPRFALNFVASRRRKKFTSQLPDMLQLLSGSLRAGYSLMQGVEAVAQEVDDPMAFELNRVLVESRLGRPLEDALEDTAARLGSPDFEWAVMAIRIQREVGGNLAELLQTVAETMIHRERLRREIKALTAEGRMSAIVLGLLPIGLGMIMYACNPEYMRVLFHDGFGKVLLGAGAALGAFGFWWMKKTITIEV